MEVLDIIIDPLGEIRAALAELGRSSRKISGVFFYYNERKYYTLVGMNGNTTHW